MDKVHAAGVGNVVLIDESSDRHHEWSFFRRGRGALGVGGFGRASGAGVSPKIVP